MKILYVYDKFPSTYQNYLILLLKLIQQKLNVKSLVYEYSNLSDYECVSYSLKDNFQRFKYKLGFSKYPSLDVKTMYKFDIVHLQHSYLWRKILQFKDKKNRPKIIITLRGADTYLKPWIDKRWSEFYKNCGHLIDAYVTVSQDQKEYLQKWGILENKIHVIPVSFGTHSNAQPKYPNKAKLKLVSAFRMTWEKNIEGSVKFAKLLKDKGIDFQYDIYGNGNDLGQLYYLVDKYNLSDSVFINGKIENSELKKELVKYDFFVQLSVSEALSVSVLEAQSVGLPCVVSNSDGLKEAVMNNETGICSNYNDINYFVDETIKLWKDSEKYYQFSKAAIDFVNNNYTLEKEEERLKKMYIEIYKSN